MASGGDHLVVRVRVSGGWLVAAVAGVFPMSGLFSFFFLFFIFWVDFF